MFHLNDSLNIWSCCAGVSCEFCQTSKSTFSYKTHPVASSVLCVYLFWYCEQVILHRQKQHQRCYIKKGTRRNFAKFSGKHLCQGLFLNKIADLRPATLLKKRLWRRRFSLNFVKFLRAPFSQNTSGRLLPYWIEHL